MVLVSPLPTTANLELAGGRRQRFAVATRTVYDVAAVTGRAVVPQPAPGRDHPHLSHGRQRWRVTGASAEKSLIRSPRTARTRNT